MGSFLKPGATSMRRILYLLHEIVIHVFKKSTHFILFALFKVHPGFSSRLVCGLRGAAPLTPPLSGPDVWYKMCLIVIAL